MLRPVVSEIIAIELAEHHAVGTEQTGGPDLVGLGPPCRAVGLDGLCFARSPDRHADRNGDGDEPARSRVARSIAEALRRIGVVEVPPLEQELGRAYEYITDINTHHVYT